MKNNHKRRFQDVDHLIQLRKKAIPNKGEYLYDYKLQDALKKRDTYSKEEFKQKFKIDFEDLPISTNTLRALKQRKFIKMTEIQRCVIPHALAERDILGASKTGSGKTLSYLLPLIENLYVNKWTPLDGLGALIILPTRELAMQVFEVFKSLNTYHILSMALLIGGKNYQYERDRITGMNVIICTPGRLLQHFEESPGFDANNLKVLVLDEADMMLELGFWGPLKAIMNYLPKEKQTMLFSATLNQTIHQLCKISLQNPESIFLHEKLATDSNEQTDNVMSTPNKLQQFYIVTPIEEKIDVLFSFIKSHNKQKIVIFVSTCKQVRYLFEVFRKLKLGMLLYELHGRQKQDKRTAIFFTFSEKKAAALFTTNIASRGLDFPKVDWVIQFDCPDDPSTYVHRVGRTARYIAGGFSMLFLLPSEVKFIDKVKQKGVEIKQKFLNSNKQLTIKQTIQSLVSENIELKYLAQRAFISYVRSVDINADKEIFKLKEIKTDLLAESMGLVQVPILTVQQPDESDQEDKPEKKSKLQKLKEKIEIKKQMAIDQNKPIETKKLKQISRESGFDKFEGMKAKTFDFEGEFLKRKPQQEIEEEEEELEQPKFVTSKRQMKKVKADGIFGGRNKVFFDDEGNQITAEEKRRQEILEGQQEVLQKDEDRTLKYGQKLIEHAEDDKANEKDRIKQKRLKKKIRMQEVQEEY
ncbi:unnamed protein product (macronuclear) [Paramecium tetraurelia]|uniref:ATP-dependent RNA helicase n=1 Tax=Paramecium tetraurelia TaxID=5888 RepID=A0DK92_PARTE|nr:uncharacterized protein GSPATT00017788001 [Paramecium tetraurelia]CAK83459.1 unnamed protein product [Paramecium tetraurelia]|eukprot:XP_001450856.1 hypothetical protein (macronuclear) [Paramecium tetraurelia strain d4-2]